MSSMKMMSCTLLLVACIAMTAARPTIKDRQKRSAETGDNDLDDYACKMDNGTVEITRNCSCSADVTATCGWGPVTIGDVAITFCALPESANDDLPGVVGQACYVKADNEAEPRVNVTCGQGACDKTVPNVEYGSTSFVVRLCDHPVEFEDDGGCARIGESEETEETEESVVSEESDESDESDESEESSDSDLSSSSSSSS